MTTVNDVLESMDYGPAPESNSHVKEWLNAHDKGFGHFINGAFVASKGKRIDVFNPANGEKIASTANSVNNNTRIKGLGASDRRRSHCTLRIRRQTTVDSYSSSCVN